MSNFSEIELLCSPEMMQAVEECLERAPLQIALDSNVPHASVVATQVKYLQRARKKLPNYYAARAILTQIGFEQSSSEECAAHKRLTGVSCIDMTCGLGVDTLYLAKNFTHVTTIERNETAAQIAKINFHRLGIENVEVLCGESQEYIKSTPKVDVIYIDPDRRSESGNKLVRLEDCSPNIVELLPTLRQKCDKLVVKNSPLFDVDEAVRVFGESVHVDVVSLRGECKEVLVTLDPTISAPIISASAVGKGEYSCNFSERSAHCVAEFKEVCKYIYIPDSSLRKSRTTASYFSSIGMEYFEGDGYGFSTAPIEAKMCNRYEIERIIPYKPKELKRMKLGRIEILKLAFPHSTSVICKSLGVREGGTERWAFTKCAEGLWAIELKK